MKSRRNRINHLSNRFFRFFCGFGDHAFFQTQDRTLYAFGSAENGVLGLVTMENEIANIHRVSKPAVVKFFKPRSKREILSASVGKHHSIFLTTGSGAWGCGKNNEGQLSDGTFEVYRYTPMKCVMEKGYERRDMICEVVCGCWSTYFLTNSGLVYSVGLNQYGQLGLGDLVSRKNGELINLPAKIVQITTGWQWAIFLSVSNRLFGTGVDYGCFASSTEETGALEGDFDVLSPVEFTQAFSRMNIKVEYVVACDEHAFFFTAPPRNEVWYSGPGEMCLFGETGQSKRKRFAHPVLCRSLSGVELFCSGNNNGFIVIKKNGKFYGCANSETHMEYFGIQKPSPLKPAKNLLELPNLEKFGKSAVQIMTRKNGVYILCEDGRIVGTGCGGDKGVMFMGGKSGEVIGKYPLLRRDFCGKEKKERIIFMCEKLDFWRVSVCLL